MYAVTIWTDDCEFYALNLIFQNLLYRSRNSDKICWREKVRWAAFAQTWWMRLSVAVLHSLIDLNHAFALSTSTPSLETKASARARETFRGKFFARRVLVRNSHCHVGGRRPFCRRIVWSSSVSTHILNVQLLTQINRSRRSNRRRRKDRRRQNHLKKLHHELSLLKIYLFFASFLKVTVAKLCG